MRKIFYISFLLLSFSALTSCSTDDKFNGTPSDNNLEFETITGVVSSDVTFALPGQLVDFTATIPQEFATKVNDTINIEALTTTLGGSLRKISLELLPGQNSKVGQILVGGGGGTFFMPVSLKLNAISVKNSVPGKQFLMDSNVITIESGDTSVPADNGNRLQIKVAWEELLTGNNIQCRISRVNSTAVTLRSLVSTSNLNINVAGVPYPIVYNTDLETTANLFYTNHQQAIFDNQGITVEVVGKALLFKYITPVAPVITVTGASGANNMVFTSALFQAVTSPFKSFPILNSQPASLTSIESANFSYNPGEYVVAINALGLESTPNNLKYRIILKKPDNTTIIFNGVYDQMTTTSGFKNILKFDKIGMGDSATYTNITQL